MTAIAIDPGADGAIVWRDDQGQAHCQKMPSTLRDIYDILEKVVYESWMDKTCADRVPLCIMEKVGTYMPGNAGPAAANFAAHVGALKMALIALKVPTELITPQKWQVAFVGKHPSPPLPNVPEIREYPQEMAMAQRKIAQKNAKKRRDKELAKRKRIRKNRMKEKAQQLFPYIKVTLWNADALGMLYVGEHNDILPKPALMAAQPQQGSLAV